MDEIIETVVYDPDCYGLPESPEDEMLFVSHRTDSKVTSVTLETRAYLEISNCPGVDSITSEDHITLTVKVSQ